MFQGTLPASVRTILQDEVARWRAQDLYLPCSGRFTIARGLVDQPNLRLHGNDVTLYSCALGAFYAQQPFRVELRREEGDDLDWMAPYMLDREGQLASVIIWSDMALPWAKRGQNVYWARMARGYRAQYPRLHEQVKRKMAAAKLRLASFYAGDCVEFVRSAPPEAGIVTFPPVYAGGYEAMWKQLEARFSWDEPEYPK